MENLLGPLLGDMDEGSMRIYRALVTETADALTLQRAFAVLCGAAAACATRFADELDHGRELADQDRAEWDALRGLLLRLADAHALGSVQGEPGEVAEALRETAAVFAE
jgi:hypothetical protein